MKLRVISGRPVVEDEHSPYHEPRDGIAFMWRALLAAAVAVLLALAGALIYRVLS